MGDDRMRIDVEVKCDRQQLPSDGRSYATLTLQFADYHDEMVELRLNGRGSFDPHFRRRRISVPVKDGRAQVQVHAPLMPGRALIAGPGFTHQLEFRAANVLQGLVHEWLPTIALSVVIALVLRTFAFASYYIPSESMMDTMKVGDLFFTENISYRVLNQEPQRGDIVVFRHPQDAKTVIKRVIGLPGDTVEVLGGRVLINGEALTEDYIKRPPLLGFPLQAVPPDSYFVMGDNRNDSADSRAWGFLPRENLLGRAALVFWPPQRIQFLEREGY